MCVCVVVVLSLILQFRTCPSPSDCRCFSSYLQAYREEESKWSCWDIWGSGLCGCERRNTRHHVTPGGEDVQTDSSWITTHNEIDQQRNIYLEHKEKRKWKYVFPVYHFYWMQHSALRRKLYTKMLQVNFTTWSFVMTWWNLLPGPNYPAFN